MGTCKTGKEKTLPECLNFWLPGIAPPSQYEIVEGCLYTLGLELNQLLSDHKFSQTTDSVDIIAMTTCTCSYRSTYHLVLLTWPSTNQTMHTFQRPTAVSGKWVALNYLDTSFVCTTGLVSALGQCGNGLEQLMHLPSSLSHPRALIKPRNAQTTGI